MNEGLYRFGGQYAEARRDGQVLSDAIEVNLQVDIQKIDMPLVGTTKTGYKPGRESRDGTMRLQKIDTYWEYQIYQFTGLSLEERRSKIRAGELARGPSQISAASFDMILHWDDPFALGEEAWQLEGCLIIWRLPLGFSIGDDIRELELPFTWDTERPLKAFSRDQAHFDRNNPVVQTKVDSSLQGNAPA